MTAKSNPGTSATAITPSDTTEYTTPFRFLQIGTAGALKITTSEGEDVIFANVPVGRFWVEATKIWANGTAASGIVGIR